MTASVTQGRVQEHLLAGTPAASPEGRELAEDVFCWPRSRLLAEPGALGGVRQTFSSGMAGEEPAGRFGDSSARGCRNLPDGEAGREWVFCLSIRRATADGCLRCQLGG